MAQISISYRRRDSAYAARVLHEKLAQRFGEDSIFYDIDDIPIGENFSEYIVNAVAKADVLLVIIGKEWATDIDHTGERQLNNPYDYVRLQIEAAFERKIPIIPVLIDDARMPPAHILPESLRGITYRNAVRLRYDSNLERDIERLIRYLEQIYHIYELAPAAESELTSIKRYASETLAEIQANLEKLVTNDEIAEPQKINESNPAKRNLIFISHSHKDKRWLEMLKTHLKPFERAGRIKRWDDTEIKAGQKWKPEIEKAIQSAKVAILLISPDFLASDFVANDELPPLLAAAEKEGAVIISLIIKHSGYQNIENIARYQAFNPPEKPLDGMSSARRNKVFSDLTGYMMDIVNGR